MLSSRVAEEEQCAREILPLGALSSAHCHQEPRHQVPEHQHPVHHLLTHQKGVEVGPRALERQSENVTALQGSSQPPTASLLPFTVHPGWSHKQPCN